MNADLFFFVTTAAVVVVSLVLVLLLVYIWRIVADIKRLTKRIRQEGDAIMDDVDDVRKSVKRPVLALLSLFTINKNKHHDKKNETKR